MAKLIRYAEEGFKNYKQELLFNGEPINGCFSFVNEVCTDALFYTFTYERSHPNLKKRDNEKINEILVDSNTMVYTKNFKLKKIETVDNDDEEEWIVKGTKEPLLVNNNMNDYVYVPLKMIEDRINYFNDWKSENGADDFYRPTYIGFTEREIVEVVLNTNDIISIKECVSM